MEKYSNNDLYNLIALCDQDGDNKQAKALKNRCEKTLAYRDYSLHILRRDVDFLMELYDPDMDPDAKATLDKIMKETK